MNQALDIAIQIDNKKQIVACHKQLYYLCREFKRMMNERGDEQDVYKRQLWKIW